MVGYRTSLPRWVPSDDRRQTEPPNCRRAYLVERAEPVGALRKLTVDKRHWIRDGGVDGA
jgi:hypothetical protein